MFIYKGLKGYPFCPSPVRGYKNHINDFSQQFIINYTDQIQSKTLANCLRLTQNKRCPRNLHIYFLT